MRRHALFAPIPHAALTRSARPATMPRARAPADLFVAMAPVTLLFCAMLWTSGKALRFCSMPLFTVFKNMAVVGTTTWEYFRFGNTVSMGAMFSLLMMVGGSVVAGYGDMTATMEGMFWLMANVVVTVAYLATLKERMPTDVSSSSKTLHNNVLTLMLFVVSSAATGELMPFCTQLSRQPARMQLGVLMTGVLGTAINMSTFWCMHVTSGATYAFVGATNKIPVAILGHFLFHSVLTPSGWMGVGFGLAAGLVYAVAKERERQLKDASAIADGAQREREHLLGENTDDAASPGKPVATRVAGGVAAAPDGPEADVELGRLGAGTVRGGEDDDLR